MENHMPDFEGVVPAIITPMGADGELNEEAYRTVYEANVQAGVHGFWVAGGTGESVYLTEAENNRIAEIVADQNQGRVNNIMHVGAATTAQAARQAEHAAKAGVEAICAVPPFFYPVGDDAVAEYYRVVGEAADLPLFLYNLPHSTGVEITPDLMKKIQDKVPQLQGLKHSSSDFHAVANFVEMGLDCFIGSAFLMTPALAFGAIGVVDGPLCIMPELWVDIWNAHQSGDGKTALAAQKRATEFSWFSRIVQFPAGFKILASERFGVDCGDPRPPFAPATDEQRESLIAEAKKQGWLPQ